MRFALMLLLVGWLSVLPATAQNPADQAVLKLNSDMMKLYDKALENAQSELLRNQPVILALFTGQGGKMILYRPGQQPLVAPRVPIRYEILKSVGHSSMAIFAHLRANLGQPDASWREPLQAYRATSQSALDALPKADMPEAWKGNVREILRRNIAFMDAALKKGTWTRQQLEEYANALGPFLKKNIAWAAETQVGHWMGVIAGWKKLLGAQWSKTLGASNTLYVTRQNNILFSVLAQFFGKDAMNSRLFLLETTEFTTTPEQMLSLMARIVADRAVGADFFHDYYLMDYELMGGDARRAILQQDRARGLPVNLPALVPFHSNEWPMRHDPSQGRGPSTLEEIKKK